MHSLTSYSREIPSLALQHTGCECGAFHAHHTRLFLTLHLPPSVLMHARASFPLRFSGAVQDVYRLARCHVLNGQSARAIHTLKSFAATDKSLSCRVLAARCHVGAWRMGLIENARLGYSDDTFAWRLSLVDNNRLP
eukprot:Opistho-1_new@70416